MDTMILAAGRGERLRPLTDTIPKPLVKIQNKALIVHHIERLKKCGFGNIIINTSYLANKIHAALGDGSEFGINIHYSDEGESALETGGGILKALNLIQSDTFIVINGDIFCDFDFARLTLPQNKLAHLILVPNPAHHPNGDFTLLENGDLGYSDKKPRDFTFAGIGCYHRELFSNTKPGKFPLTDLLFPAIKQRKVSAEVFKGQWTDVGTLERLESLNNQLNAVS